MHFYVKKKVAENLLLYTTTFSKHYKGNSSVFVNFSLLKRFYEGYVAANVTDRLAFFVCPER